MSDPYKIEDYENLFKELSSIKNDLINSELTLADSISKLKRAKEINMALEIILNEAEKEVEKLIESDKDCEINRNIYDTSPSNEDIPF